MWTSLALSFLAAHGAFDYEREIERSHDLGERTALQLAHTMGALEVSGWDQPRVGVQMKIVVRGDRAAEFGEGVELKSEETGDALRLATSLPKGEWEELSYDIRLQIRVPRLERVELRHTFGDARLKEVHAGLIRVDVQNGRLEMADTRGDLELAAGFSDVLIDKLEAERVQVSGDNGNVQIRRVAAGELALARSFGNVHIEDAAGNLVAKCSNSTFHVYDLDGSVRLESQFGELYLRGVRGDVQLAGRNSSLRGEQITGAVQVENTSGAVTLSGVQGDVVVHMAGERVQVSDVAGSARVSNQFGDVYLSGVGESVTLEAKNGSSQVERVGGSIEAVAEFVHMSLRAVRGNCTVKSKNGTVQLQDVQGDATVANTFGQVTATRVRGALVVHNQNGPVTASGLSYESRHDGELNGGSKKKIECTTTFGSIQLYLPTPADFELDALATFGGIESDFPLTGLDKDVSEQRCKCTLGEGAALIRLVSESGGIYLHQER